MPTRPTATFNIPFRSGFLLLVDPANIEDQEKWHTFSTARRGHKIDFDGPDAEQLTRNEREFMPWEKMADGVLRIFGKTNQETGILAEGKKKLAASGGLQMRIEHGPIDQSISLIEDACRADYAGVVPSLDGVAIKTNEKPGRSPAQTAKVTIEYGEDGRPSRATIDFPR